MPTSRDIEWARRWLEGPLARGRQPAGYGMMTAGALRALHHGNAGSIGINPPARETPIPPARPSPVDREHPLWDRWIDG
jgi:hypothetical protein